MTQQLQTAELLAPAGSLEAFFAALDAGADAIYVGLKEFSARAKAKNFSLSDLQRMTWLLQGQGKRLYVALNTLVKEEELPLLIETLAALEKIGVDAVILQDLAVWKLAKEHFPGLELHASTQLTIHNIAGVKMLERMGFTRGVLARELTLAEIAKIRQQTTLELEHFIHGALCFSFSGQCYFSSFLSGKSGNRGRCAQPCRRHHSYRQSSGYYFSPNDLSAIDVLPELQQAGICSLKIEGRMKSAEYVHKVVRAYRSVLDADDSTRPGLLKEAKLLLKESFGRQPTQGFLAGQQPGDMAISTRKGATGRYLGEISQVRGADISFKSKEPLHIGDRLRIQPASDKSGTAFTIRELQLGKRSLGKVPAGSFVTVPTTFYNQFVKGDGVFMVSSKDAFALSDVAARRKLAEAKAPPRRIKLAAEVTATQLQLTASCAEGQATFAYAIDSYPAEKRSLNQDILSKALAPTQNDPFRLGHFSSGPLPEIVIPPSRLKQIRRELYRQLEESLPEQAPVASEAHRQAALSALLPAATRLSQQPRCLRLVLRDLRDQHILQTQGIDEILLPLSAQNVQQAQRLTRRASQLIWDIPFVQFDPDWQSQRSAIRQLVKLGFKRFRLNNLGHFPLFDQLEDLQLYSSFRLFALNSQSICALNELGIDETELYIEDERENLQATLSRELPRPTALTVFASVPLLTSRVKIKGVRADSPVLSDRGDAFRVSQKQNLTWLNSDNEFSFIGNLNELEQFGCHNFIVDLSHDSPFSAKGKQLLEALQQGIDPPSTSKFNYLSGLE